MIHAKWPEPGAVVDEEAKAGIERLIELISKVRTVRTELNVPPSAVVNAVAWTDGIEVARWLESNSTIIKRLARISVDVVGITLNDDEGLPSIGELGLQTSAVEMGANVQVSTSGIMVMLELAGAIDLTAERARLTKAIEAVTKERDALAGRLNNPAFVEKAKPEAVEKARADMAEKSAEAERLSAALARLG